MIRKVAFVMLAVIVFSTGFSQETARRQRPSRRGENAGYGSRNATILSMMGWGLGLGVGIATICALIPNNESSSTSSSSSSHTH